MSLRGKMGRLLGGTYGFIYRLPVVGESAVRGINRALGFVNSHAPGGMKRRDSMAELRRDLERALAMMDVDVAEINHDDESIELVMNSCFYGFRRPEQAGVCDAAMDMDRTMFGYCGCDLAIEERLPHGDPVCRVIIRRRT